MGERGRPQVLYMIFPAGLFLLLASHTKECIHGCHYPGTVGLSGLYFNRASGKFGRTVRSSLLGSGLGMIPSNIEARDCWYFRNSGPANSYCKIKPYDRIIGMMFKLDDLET